MPPWSSRLATPNPRGEGSSNTTGANSAGSARLRGPSAITEADILESAYGIPTLQPRRPSGAPAHGRSMSHPFPSLFSSRKKRSGDGGKQIGGFESTDDDSAHSSSALKIPLSTGPKQGKVPDKDLRVGRCMTCDSTIRWPKELKMFRCSICLMINDLKPVVLDVKRGDGRRPQGAGRAGTDPGISHPSRVEALSLERTRQLVDECITAYLLERLKHDNGHTSSPNPSPPHSPKEKPEDQDAGARIHNMPYPDGHNVKYHQPKPPTHSSGEVGCADVGIKSDRTGRQNPRLLQYSTSSPGSFLGAHMANREKELPPLPIEAYEGNRLTRLKPSDEHFAFEKDASQAGRQKTNTESIFKPLEDYLTASFGSFECINRSFLTNRPNLAPRAASEGSKKVTASSPTEKHSQSETYMSEMDAKTLLLGNFAENGSWWTGDRVDIKNPERSNTHRHGGDPADVSSGIVSLRSPRIEWTEVNEWYHLVIQTSRSWRRKIDDLVVSEQYASQLKHPSRLQLDEIEDHFTEAQGHTQRLLMKVTENLLKRPGRPLQAPDDLRFLLIILANPLLYSSHFTPRPRGRTSSRSRSQDIRVASKSQGLEAQIRSTLASLPQSSNTSGGSSGQHSVIIKRILGLLSNAPNECHRHLVSWFARFSDGQFQRTVDLIGSFVTYRLTRQSGKKREEAQDPTAGLIPSLSGPGGNTSAALHAALGGVGGQPPKKSDKKLAPVVYSDDWQIKAAAKVMMLMFSANNSGLARRADARPLGAFQAGHSAGLAAREKAHTHGQIIATSDFYNTLLDYSDLVADFEAWETGHVKFAFCQYPFFLSIWAKIQIMEHDAKRQMEVKAREAFFDSIMTHKTVNQYLVLKIRRECLVEDSLKGVSEVVGAGGEEIKKGLRIEFKEEEGIDAGGLRKEWFLLLVRDVFNPEHGMFTYDEDSHFCYFNPNSFETTDQFFLVGVVLGLAIYNSTILDVALPPFAFRKLLAAGPAAAPGSTSHAKPSMTYSLEDLAEYRPVLANGLRQLLEFDGDVETTFCRDFVADIERYGQTIQVPLCPDGEKRPVTNTNRREFVDMYVRYLLDTAVVRQFEPFKRGFFTVCGGNALSLFRPEEIELLIRGSDEPLDINSLRVVAKYENWGVPNAAEMEPVVSWFWNSFEAANPKNQRKLLSFITGSDRIPATGATMMVIKLSCLGDDSPRFPVARTCFNMLSLWRYNSREKLEAMLWRAVYESEGFGLK